MRDLFDLGAIKKRLRPILLNINRKTMIVTALAVLSTCNGQGFGISVEFPLTMIATAIVFLVVFSIGGAFKRREGVLDEYGVIKSHGRAIYFATRDWLENPSYKTLDKARFLLGELLDSCRKLFQEPVEQIRDNEEVVYRNFSKLSKFIRKELRENGLGSGECSRCNPSAMIRVSGLTTGWTPTGRYRILTTYSVNTTHDGGRCRARRNR